MGYAAGHRSLQFARMAMDMASATHGAFGDHDGSALNPAPLGDGLQIGQRTGQWTATRWRVIMHAHRSAFLPIS
jgi:hypothetical protein